MSQSDEIQITKRRGNDSETVIDHVAREEPLEIRVEGRSIAVVMRTPDHDEELAAGFLLSEGVIHTAADVFEISQCPSQDNTGNVIDVLLADASAVDWDSLTRHVFSSSSCGICGKATIESVLGCSGTITDNTQVSADLIRSLPDKLRSVQETFDKTGGLHASAIFDTDGTLLIHREDVGRHNALDKVIGHSLLNKQLPLTGKILLLSGRISFELMQKSQAAGIAIIAGISAPSSLAVDFAKESNQTLIGFLRGQSMNIYTGAQRIV
jgi:FdhD protein